VASLLSDKKRSYCNHKTW